MDDNSPNGNLWVRTLTALAIALVTVSLLTPAIDKPEPSYKTNSRILVSTIVSAVKAYNIEYGKYPGLDRQGAFLDAESNAFLLRILRGLDPLRNPRKIVFFEAREIRPRGLFKPSSAGGLDPKTGALLDPWGNPYRIVIDADYDNVIANPYSDDPPLQTGVIVWSLGKDGKQGAPANPHTYKGSDDVTSWR